MASTPTPEQIEVYAATLRARTAETARRRRERREEAWTTARQAAEILRAQFGATGVWVFGSLVDGDHFTERSDIDIAASGLTPALHLEALGRLLRLTPDFEFDLVDLESCRDGLRQAVEQHGVEL
jgi:predicted nucleotidyltransferase